MNLAKTKNIMITLFMAVTLCGCADEISYGTNSSVSLTADSENTSAYEDFSSVLIISFDSDNKDEVLDYICEKYNLEIVYNYQNFNMAAVKTDATTNESLQEYINQISKEDGILYVNKDETMTLD